MPVLSESYVSQRIRRAKERGRRMANARWERERQRQRAVELAESSDPLRAPGRILRRIILIEGDGVTAREIVRYSHDSVRSWRRKLRRFGLSTSEREMPDH